MEFVKPCQQVQFNYFYILEAHRGPGNMQVHCWMRPVFSNLVSRHTVKNIWRWIGAIYILLRPRRDIYFSTCLLFYLYLSFFSPSLTKLTSYFFKLKNTYLAKLGALLYKILGDIGKFNINHITWLLLLVAQFSVSFICLIVKSYEF